MAANDGEEKEEATEVVVEEATGLKVWFLTPRRRSMVFNCLGLKDQDKPIIGARRRNDTEWWSNHRIKEKT